MRQISVQGIFILLLFVGPLPAVDTTIKGGRMEVFNQVEKVVFSGGVRMERGTDILTAQTMITNKTRDKVTAEGQVVLIRHVSDTETWKGWGETGFYDTKSGAGYLIGSKKVAHVNQTEILSSTSTRVMDIFSNRFDFLKNAKQAEATGAVYGKTIDPDTLDFYEFWSEKANYDGNKRQVILSGPVPSKLRQQVKKDVRIVKGDVITYWIDDRKLLSDGNAVSVFEDYPEEAKN